MSETRVVEIKRKALEANETVAQRLRREWTSSRTLVVNLISSPGSGKTTLLESTVSRLRQEYRIAVLEGDVATERDAERIRALGVPAHQILTGGACHLEAQIVEKNYQQANFGELDILFIENVGNLICPTSYDLGEDFKVVLLSTAEGEDKPFKYPAIFSKASFSVITKSDLLPYLPFNLEAVREQITTLNPKGRILLTSTVSGEGLDEWCDLLRTRLQEKRAGSA